MKKGNIASIKAAEVVSRIKKKQKHQSKSTSNPINKCYYFLILFAIISIITSIYIEQIKEKLIDFLSLDVNSVMNGSEAKKPVSLELEHYQLNLSYNDIKIKKWKVGGTFLRDIVKGKEPIIIINNKELQHWKLYQTDLLNISKCENILLNYSKYQKGLSNSIFISNHEREKGGMLGKKHSQTNLQLVSVSLKDFLNAAFNPEQYISWTGKISLWENITGSDFNLNNFKIYEKGIKDINEVEENIWEPAITLSHPGIAEQIRYDTFHNIIIQVQGLKRFILFSPESELYMYPSIHRSYKQSQVRFEKKDDDNNKDGNFPKSYGLNAKVVDLQPGDILYIPPYWNYRQESTTLSLSLSIQSPSLMEQLLSEAYWQQVPFGDFSSSIQLRSFAVHYYLYLLIKQINLTYDNINNDNSIYLSSFTKNLYESRFQSIYPLSDIKPPMTATETSKTDPNSNVNLISMCANITNEDVIEKYTKHKNNFILASERVVKLLNHINTNINTDNNNNNKLNIVKESFLRDYVEQIVRWAIGVDKSPSYIHYCLGNKVLEKEFTELIKM
jgi:hypothetical protein